MRTGSTPAKSRTILCMRAVPGMARGVRRRLLPQPSRLGRRRIVLTGPSLPSPLLLSGLQSCRRLVRRHQNRDRRPLWVIGLPCQTRGRSLRQADYPQLPRSTHPTTNLAATSSLLSCDDFIEYAHFQTVIDNQCISLLRSVYRRPCVDFEGLANPVDLWLAGGGRFHRKPRRKIPPPPEILPRWRKGIESVVSNPALRDVFWFGMYTGMRLGEVLPLRWERVNREELVFRVDETKTGAPLELPITRQLAAILDRRWAESGHLPGGWVFPSASSRTGYFVKLTYFHRRISEAGGAKFWFHGLRNCFITVAERELMLPHALTKRLVNHAPPNDVTEGYASDWTIGQLRGPAQRIADRIEGLMRAESGLVIGEWAKVGSS